MHHLGLFLLVILSYEFLNFCKFRYLIKKNLDSYKKLFKLLKLKNISDNYKQNLLLKYSKNLFTISIKIGLILCVLILFFFIIDYLTKDLISFLFSILGMIEITFLILIYIILRKKIHAKL